MLNGEAASYINNITLELIKSRTPSRLL